jgi:hypothetical protein
MDGVAAPVGGVAPALQEPGRLAVVDDRDHGARVDPQPVGQLLLGDAVVGAEHGDHGELARVEAEGLHGLGEAAAGGQAELGQEKPGVLRQLSGHAADQRLGGSLVAGSRSPHAPHVTARR